MPTDREIILEAPVLLLEHLELLLQIGASMLQLLIEILELVTFSERVVTLLGELLDPLLEGGHFVKRRGRVLGCLGGLPGLLGGQFLEPIRLLDLRSQLRHFLAQPGLLVCTRPLLGALCYRFHLRRLRFRFRPRLGCGNLLGRLCSRSRARLGGCSSRRRGSRCCRRSARLLLAPYASPQHPLQRSRRLSHVLKGAPAVAATQPRLEG
mmetsp:Transcript_3671/g.11636  ORF Transcript_3671/g.11636 Transcript_3671/m.11636 type:complete len:209 (+) Transcript_3671:1170-1796(+)